jgi:hypothetical protein
VERWDVPSFQFGVGCSSFLEEESERQKSRLGISLSESPFHCVLTKRITIMQISKAEYNFLSEEMDKIQKKKLAGLSLETQAAFREFRRKKDLHAYLRPNQIVEVRNNNDEEWVLRRFSKWDFESPKHLQDTSGDFWFEYRLPKGVLEFMKFFHNRIGSYYPVDKNFQLNLDILVQFRDGTIERGESKDFDWVERGFKRDISTYAWIPEEY